MIIKNGLVALPGEKALHPCDIEIVGGKILTLGQDLPGSNILDAHGLQIFPGAIDPHVHFNDPGFTEREDFIHGSQAAAAGGVTTIIDMPCTSIPPVTTLENFKIKLEAIASKSVVDFGFFGGVSGKCFESDVEKNMQQLAPEVLGFKTYFVSSMETFPRVTLEQFIRVLQLAAPLDRPVLLHAEDYETVTQCEAMERKKGNRWENYVASRPEEAEILAVRKAVDLAERWGGNLHIVHVSTAEAAHYLSGKTFATGETCPHYLEFSRDDFARLGSALKTAPCVKGPSEKEKLWTCLKESMLDFIASDHAPAPSTQKNTGSVWTDYAGIPGTQTLFLYAYSQGFCRRHMSLDTFLKITSENAARRYGLFDRKGSIEPGKDADLILIDPHQTTEIHGQSFFSKGKITPFEGQIFQGKILKTILRGQTIYDAEKGITASPGTGHILRKG